MIKFSSCLDHGLGMRQADEPVLVQALVPKSPVERFDIRILIGFSGFDQEQSDATCVRPGQHRLATELLAVVSASRLRQTTPPGQ